MDAGPWEPTLIEFFIPREAFPTHPADPEKWKYITMPGLQTCDNFNVMLAY